MAVYESRVNRNGVPVTVEYILRRLSPTSVNPHLHYHEFAELLFGISGMAEVVIGERRFVLGEGSMVLVYPNEPHDVVYAGGSCSYHVVKFLPQVLLTGEESYPEYTYAMLLMEQMRERRIYFPAEELEETDVPEIFCELREEWESRRFGYELSLRADVTRLFLYVLRRWQEDHNDLTEAFLLSAKGTLLQKAVTYVREHYTDLSEEDAALACGVSPSYLSRSFKRGMGMSFSAYVMGVRLRESRRLLLTTDESVTDIAQALGFSTSAYFIACFRQRYGATPHRYRTAGKGETVLDITDSL